MERLTTNIGRFDSFIGRLDAFIGRLDAFIGRLGAFVGWLGAFVGWLGALIGRLDASRRVFIRNTDCRCVLQLLFYMEERFQWVSFEQKAAGINKSWLKKNPNGDS
ncbi:MULTISPECIES: hypothetical protein [Allobacillus]|uniref:Uncharacterized protein n=1 Tax=Allobacillus salarius TaxID=1955272 RepID=A0A556PS72_9BACI|nr:hypothetical protein [Allobacillus salarius]TSJ67232.1 hypothetical protein FPQ13_02945 [Allobacillus salarius]